MTSAFPEEGTPLHPCLLVSGATGRDASKARGLSFLEEGAEAPRDQARPGRSGPGAAAPPALRVQQPVRVAPPPSEPGGYGYSPFSACWPQAGGPGFASGCAGRRGGSSPSCSGLGWETRSGHLGTGPWGHRSSMRCSPALRAQNPRWGRCRWAHAGMGAEGGEKERGRERRGTEAGRCGCKGG